MVETDRSDGDEKGLPTTDAQWRQRLSPEAYRVLRRSRTERPFTGEHLDCHEAGTFRCAACGGALFSSEGKYDSGSGWPSFSAPVTGEAVSLRRDWKMLLLRTEVRCTACGSHLGHVFVDRPSPSGVRYCINSIALDFDRGDQG